MTQMFHDLTEEEVRRRIEKARSEGSSTKYRLENALVLVELVARMLNPVEDEAEAPAPEVIPDPDPVVDEDPDEDLEDEFDEDDTVV